MSDIRDLESLRDALRDFAAARDWRQFHTPKNLAMAMIVEAAELVEHFQWATPEESCRPPAEISSKLPRPSFPGAEMVPVPKMSPGRRLQPPLA